MDFYNDVMRRPNSDWAEIRQECTKGVDAIRQLLRSAWRNRNDRPGGLVMAVGYSVLFALFTAVMLSLFAVFYATVVAVATVGHYVEMLGESQTYRHLESRVRAVCS